MQDGRSLPGLPNALHECVFTLQEEEESAGVTLEVGMKLYDLKKFELVRSHIMLRQPLIVDTMGSWGENFENSGHC